MIFFTSVAIFFTSTYLVGVGLLWYYWHKIKPTRSKASFKPQTYVSVVVVMRNESQYITALLNSLYQQNYPKELFEVIVIDDDSSDGSFELVEQFQKQNLIQLQLIRNESNKHIASFKKRAITSAIALAQGTLIACTDADCVVPPNWLLYFAYLHETTDAQFMSGGVAFHSSNAIFEKLQSVEFASLVASGAACIQLETPTMCNGANLAYTQKAFREVDGYAGVEHLASGDDEFLMHKIAKKYPQKVFFLKNKQHSVFTPASPSPKHFFQQRIRWASKWEYYKDWQTKLIAVWVFLANLSNLFFMSYLAFSHQLNTTFIIFLSLFITRFFIEFLFLRQVLLYFQKRRYSWWIAVVYIFYPFYVVFFGLIARFFSYTWKNRKF